MYISKTVGQKEIKHLNSTETSIKKYAEEQAWTFGYCDIFKDNQLILTAYKPRNDYKVKFIEVVNV